MSRVARAAAIGALALACQAQAQPTDESKRVAPYAPTDEPVTEAMLDLARVGPADRVVDLGSGDGRIVIAAARRGATGLGVEIDAKLVALARDKAEQAGVASRARFVQQDLFETDLREASVITIYLLPSIMGRVATKLRELAPGTRVVSHDFVLPGWSVERVVTLDAPGKRDHHGKETATLYLYTAPRQPAR